MQFRSDPGRVRANRDRSLESLSRAVEQDADLAVLPELCQSGYDLSPNQAREVAEPADGPTVQRWARVARGEQMYIVGGICERDGDEIYNSGVMVGPEGHVGTYRKVHLYDEEKDRFEPGDRDLPVFETDLGTLAMLICYDLRFPEAVRTLALKEAQLICVPTAWITPTGKQLDETGLCIQAHCAMALSSINRIYMACADLIGPCGATRFLGGSLLTGPDGWPVVGPAPVDEPEVLIADVDLTEASSKEHSPRNNLLNDRRTDLYGTYPIESEGA